MDSRSEYFGDQRPVFDGKKNLYSKRPLPGINRERVRLPIRSSSLNLNLVNWNIKK